MTENRRKPETLAIHAGERVDDPAAVMPPIHLSTTFRRDAEGSYPGGYIYGRTDNPNRRMLEARVAALEGGADATAFASGTAASLAVFHAIPRGSHIVATRGAYFGTTRQLRDVVRDWGHGVSIVDTADIDTVRDAMHEDTRLIWLETPNNPSLRIADIAACAELCRDNGALLACDNTVATPVFQNPLALGADLAMHSSTKYLGGHSDVTGGIVVAREAGDVMERLRAWQDTGGGVPSPFDCWLLTRSIATLAVRVRAQASSAARIAAFLDDHEAVESVHYPGLPSHPQHALASAQMRGYGALLSFCLAGGEEAAWRTTGALSLITPATSLGGVESLIEHRASVEGPQTETPKNLLRLSVGLEDVDDLIDDLGEALNAL